jgi:hypothetical protein
LPLKTEEELPANYKRPRKKEMWRMTMEKERKGNKQSSNGREHIGKEESKVLSSIGNEISQASAKDKLTPDGHRDSDIDFLFKQFNVRNSFTIDDSSIKKWKKDSILGKRGSEVQDEELEMSLITDLKGLKKHEQEKEDQKIMEKNMENMLHNKSKTFPSRNMKKKYISDFFGEGGKKPSIKRYVKKRGNNLCRVKCSDKKYYYSRNTGWKDFYRKEEETIRDVNGFIVLENPQEYGKISDLWKGTKKNTKKESGKKSGKKKRSAGKKDMCQSQKTTTNTGEGVESKMKVKFFETFDQMTQHMKDKSIKLDVKNSDGSNENKSQRKKKKEKSEKSRRKSNEDESISSHSISESRRRKGKKGNRNRKESVSNKNLLKQNLEDHHLNKIQFLSEKLEKQNKQFEEYSKKVKEVLRIQILKNEEHEKQKRRRRLQLAKERLGEYMLRGGMSKTKEVWVDGGCMKDVKERLNKVRKEKEIREKFRKTLKRRKQSTITAEEITTGELASAKESKFDDSILTIRKPSQCEFNEQYCHDIPWGLHDGDSLGFGNAFQSSYESSI